MANRAARDYYETTLDLLNNTRHTKWISISLLTVDAVLCALIIKTVAYTEIDWVAYMQQVAQYIAGERDYTLIKGNTGPLVYPAAHVYIYRGLHAITDGGRDVTLAQICFAVLYLFNLGVVMACYRLARVPPYVFPMLVFSKRLHSIYMLRCFNDGFAMGALFVAIYLYQRGHWTYGSIAFSLGLGVKMSLLLVLPAVAVILYQALGPNKAWRQALIIVQLQVLLGMPFMRKNLSGYLSRAFDLSRQFKYEWTVNWKFVSEEVFLSRSFSIALLAIHASLLLLFIGTRWMKPLNRSPKSFIRNLFTERSADVQAQISNKITPEFILTTILTSNAIGMLCARSLHFQFFSWIAWATPFLLWRAKLNPILQYVLWLGQEVAWNMYPPNELGSKIVVGVLAVVVVEVWIATDDEEGKKSPAEQVREMRKKII